MTLTQKFMRTFIAGAALLTFTATVSAGSLDVTIYENGGDGQMAECSSSTVSGLNPNGDGFLAVRSGPGSKYRKLDELHNGDVVIIYDQRGPWLGVMYGANTGDCGFVGNGKRALPYKGKKGWIHGKWTRPLAG